MMAIALKILVLILYLSHVASWTYTEYITVVTTEGFDLETTTTGVTVSPTGPVSPLSTEVTTTETLFNYAGTAWFNLTVTDLYLGPGASVCTPSNYEFICRASTTSTYPAGTIDPIVTGVWAAVTISNPSTCTQTSFTYTTSSFDILQLFGDQVQFPTIFNEAADTGTNGEALFVTTYISTVSVDLGGQAITTTRCDIWLKNGALASISPNDEELGYLENCVDPRRYLCGSYDSSATCGTDWIGTYPMTPGAVTSVKSTAASTTSRGGGPAPSSTAKAGGVEGGRDILHGGLRLTALLAAASLCILL